jgi:hypothetical protein
MRNDPSHSAHGARVGASARRTRRKIDFSDIQKSTAAQLKAMLALVGRLLAPNRVD